MTVRTTRWIAIALTSLLAISGFAPRVLAAPSLQSGALVQVATNAKLGAILVNAQGMTLYTLSSEAGGNVKCSGGCLAVWPPVIVPAGTTPSASITGAAGTFGVLTRADGTQQLTYNGLPLYTFAHDTAPGDTNGEGIQAFGGTWHAALATAVPLSATVMQRLAIHITTTAGTVWGKVTASYVFQHQHLQRVCAQANCVFYVPRGVKIRLTQSPTSASTWPFRAWQIRVLLGRGRTTNVTRATAIVQMKSSYRVKVVYVLG